MASDMLVNISSGNGLSLVWHQTITKTNTDLLSDGPFRRKFNEVWIKISKFCFKRCIWEHRPQNGGHFVQALTYWGRVTHICVGNLTNTGSDNGLSPGRRQAIIWTDAGILLIGPLGTNFSEILIGIQTFSFKETHLKMSSAKWRLFPLGLNELMLLSPFVIPWPLYWYLYTYIYGYVIYWSLYKLPELVYRCHIIYLLCCIPKFCKDWCTYWMYLINREVHSIETVSEGNRNAYEYIMA